MQGGKGKIEANGILSLKAGGKKGDDSFTDFSFKEGNTATVPLKDIFVQEKGQAAYKKITEPSAPAAAAKVAGGAKNKKKAAAKGAKKRPESAGNPDKVRNTLAKVINYKLSKTAEKNTPKGGKASAARKTKSPAMPTPSGKKSQGRTTDQMTMAQFKKFIAWSKDNKPSATGGKVLGKRSAGKASASSGKASKGAKRVAK